MWKQIFKTVSDVFEPENISKALDPDRALMLSMAGLIESCGVRYALGNDVERYRPGKPLKLVLAGYVGSRNTGADVRVEEMLRQFRAIFGDDHIELSIMTLDRKLTAGYFRTVRQIEMPVVFPKFLYDECPKYHGVIACEGSMFKSKFANALTTFMAGALGMAAAENKLAVGYGAEAGQMDPPMRRFVKRYCRDSLVICRNEPSRGVLGDLGIRTKGGTDTAWTFEPAPKERGEALLRAAGWDGAQKVIAVCPINPFWWPVKPDVFKAAAFHLAGQHKREHYRSIYFHHQSEESDAKNKAYLGGIAKALIAYVKESGALPILVGMEQLDRYACEALAERLPFRAPLFVSDEHDMYDMVSVLRRCSSMISSRYHAIVTSMPGLVPSAGITMDERIRNLMNDREHPEMFLEVDGEQLGEKLMAIIRRRDREGEA
ncbi:MAG: polysaccharide pyruvyl transferase family protein, partial [Myxococcales bacterium]|nr:polysaccharide pyruvyl transferase family protein [Myxococcales bacterium]